MVCENLLLDNFNGTTKTRERILRLIYKVAKYNVEKQETKKVIALYEKKKQVEIQTESRLNKF